MTSNRSIVLLTNDNDDIVHIAKNYGPTQLIDMRKQARKNSTGEDFDYTAMWKKYGWTTMDTANWSRQLWSKELSSGVSMLEEASWDGYDRYWLTNFSIEKELHQRVLVPMKIADAIIEVSQPTKIFLSSGSTDLEKAVCLLAKNNDIPVNIINPAKSPTKEKFLPMVKSAFPLATTCLPNYEYFQTIKDFKETEKKKNSSIFFVSTANNIRPQYLPEQDSKEFTDVQFGQIIPLLAKDHAMLLVNQTSSESKDIQWNPRIPMLNPPIKKIPLRDTPFLIKEMVKFSPALMKEIKKSTCIWKRIKQDKTLRESSTLDNTNIWELIQPFLKDVWTRLFPPLKIQVMQYHQMLEHIEPSVVATGCEYGEYRVLHHAARTRGIPTMATQHGLITPNHCGYMMKTPGNKEMEQKISETILPTLTAVDGKGIKKMLVENSIYKDEQVMVAGRPRYDTLLESLPHYNREELIEQYQLQPNKPTILYITQPIPEPLLQRHTRDTILEALKEVGDTNILIKVHPGEKESVYTKVAKDMGLSVKVVKHVDLYGCLFVADVMVHSYSTVGLEALLVGTPFISVNITGGVDLADYVPEGVSLGAGDKSEVARSIKKILDGEWTADSRVVEKYMKDKLGPLDGRSAERIAEAVDGLIT